MDRAVWYLKSISHVALEAAKKIDRDLNLRMGSDELEALKGALEGTIRHFLVRRGVEKARNQLRDLGWCEVS